MDSNESRNENLTQQENETSKSKTLQKAKRKCNSEEAENSSPSGTLRKTLYDSLSRLSLRRRSKNVSVEMKDTEDGGPLVYPMDKRGQLFIIRTYLCIIVVMRVVLIKTCRAGKFLVVIRVICRYGQLLLQIVNRLTMILLGKNLHVLIG